MSFEVKAVCAAILLGMLSICQMGSNAIAQDTAWRVSKSSGEVWISNSGVQKATLTDQMIVQPGDTIQTGQTGRALLVRGEESILISPNSVIGVPRETKNGMSTVITQQAGSVLLEVEKRKVNHFEVDTPYLAAVVKGTQFRVAVARDGSSVDVLRGRVEVTDFKSGEYTLVTPGQTAKVYAQGATGLSLSGSGTLGPVYQGSPRSSSVSPILEPDESIKAPSDRQAALQSRGSEPQAVIKPIDAAPEALPDLQIDTGNFISRMSARLSESDGVVSALSIPLGVGGFVAVTVSVSRNRRKKKQQTPN